MASPSLQPATLYVVATPLGNLEDITLRAIKILQQVEIIACEDTRRASILLKHLAISGKRLISYHTQNEPRAIAQIVALLEEGNNVALITDAGTPAVSDPGFALLRAVHERGIVALPIPGASAVTAALSVCPLPLNTFLFGGFLPHKKGRKTKLAQLSAIGQPFVLYESPYRIHKLLDELEAILPNAQLFIGREMTKLHEEYLTGSIEEMRQHLTSSKTKGEFVVIVHPTAEKTINPESDTDADY
uniref:Ribosomal RNA small subunit methyltransferase I n=1 Tax=Chlorobium chlorochromatii (strain CaD3) TaxID=340177 RepID=Q3APW8_CHLCH